MRRQASVRASDWEDRLSNFLEICREREFGFGHHDHLLFALGGVRAITGIDPAEDLRETYSDEAGYAAKLAELADAGGHAATLFALTNKRLGPSKAASLAKRGDLVGNSERDSLGICVGQWSWFVRDGVTGMVAVPTADCERAWSVRFA